MNTKTELKDEDMDELASLDDVDGEFLVEVEDDTPPQDRGRAPLPDEIKRKLDEEDEVEEYSSKVQERIDQMKKAWHYERRAKEAAQRERDEATRVAQLSYQERLHLQRQIAEGDVWALEQAKQRAQLQMESAKKAYRDAYERGDTDEIITAQEALNKAMMENDKVSQYRPRPAPQPDALQPQPSGVYTQSARPAVDPRVADWSKSNPWFGKDEEATSFALGVHQKLVKSGVDPTSDEYFERLDARISQVFPELIGGAPKKRRTSSTVVAPVGRSPKGQKVVLTQTQISLAKRLGISPEEYARELVKINGGAA
jgi:hypothetical protein